MGILKDLLDISREVNGPILDVDDFSIDDDGQPYTKYRPVSHDSIAKQAKNGTAQFPIIATRSLSYDTLQMIAKVCERQFASMLQTVFTMNQITDTDNPQEFVHQYHQNMNTTVKGAGDVIGMVFNSANPPTGVMNDLKINSLPFDAQFEPRTINEKFQPVDYKMAISYEAYKYRNGIENQSPVVETKDYNPHQIGKEKIPANIFSDNDAKKANELVPTLMHVRILKERGPESVYVDFIVGVKAMLHPVNSTEIIDHVLQAMRERGKLFRLIQWTTGEISLLKDLILNIDQAKNDLKEIRSGASSTWWRALKNIKASRRFHKWTRTSPVLPNATLVMSMDEVDYIKANNQFDLMEEHIAKKLMESYGLLQFVIVDQSSEVAHFMVDGEDRFATNTFKGLERQNGDADKQFKEILRAVNKLN